MRRAGLAAIAVALPALAIPTGASAQDWSGFYLGANLGGIWGNSDASASVACTPPNATAYICSNTALQSNGAAVGNAGTGSLSDDGVIGGGQAGYNAQTGGFVYGFELDISAVDLGASRVGAGTFTPNGAFTFGSSLSTNWLFTTRGRLGFSVSHLLLYATGGLAVTDLETSHTYRDNLVTTGTGALVNFSKSETKAGYVIGGGAEVALGGSWTLRGEYLYVNFGSVGTSGQLTNVDFPGQANPISMSEDLSAHIARAGVNYRFNTPH